MNYYPFIIQFYRPYSPQSLENEFACLQMKYPDLIVVQMRCKLSTP